MRFSPESPIKMRFRDVTNIYFRCDYRESASPNAGFLRFLWLAVILANLSTLANGAPVRDGKPTLQLSTTEKPEVATELVDVVAAFIAAGEKDDPAARGKYLGSEVFYYGHARTHEQVLREIANLYRRWPRRKLALTESIDLFEVPNHRGVYRVTAVYEYKFDSRNEHLSGKSRLTCIVEHNAQGTRITGVDEKLLNGTTEYQSE